ncbi:hypothetical protein BN1723_001987 [Verticillium longisporum]|uniref:Uncharacterized protein n=1 Tax=Verticillium longisporum TaxID=100787 RepID=A0A0G4KVE1_VERLO|nr:hypothetical protein BN1723_001987 [Verticillium longisporum]
MPVTNPHIHPRAGFCNCHLTYFAITRSRPAAVPVVIHQSTMSHKPKDPLDQLQYMLNDVIIQIGKALKASTKQPNRQNVSQIHASLQTRMPETIENFHWALNDLESEVMRAKGALQRDLDRLQQRRAPQPEEAIKASPAPMIASPASVTLVVASPELAQKSPPSPPLKEEPTQSAPFSAAQESPAPPPMAPMAPIPDMGGNDSMPTPVQPKADIKREPTPSVPQAMMAPMDSIPVKSEETPATSSVAPEPSVGMRGQFIARVARRVQHV